MNAPDWTIALEQNATETSLFAFCDWLEEQGESETATAARRLPGLWRDMQRLRRFSPDRSYDYLLVGLQAWKLVLLNHAGTTGTMPHPDTAVLVQACTGGWYAPVAPLAKWWQAYTGCRFTRHWRSPASVEFRLPDLEA